MATPSELVRVVADVLSVPEATVVQHDRNLLAAGMRSKGGRGLGAAQVTASDASNLLIATAASWLKRSSVETVSEYSALIFKDRVMQSISRKQRSEKWQLRGLPIPALINLPAIHSIGNALTSLIESAADGSLDLAIAQATKHDRYFNLTIDVVFTGPVAQSTIGIRGHSYELANYGKQNAQTLEDYEVNRGKLKQSRSFDEVVILAIGACLRDKKEMTAQ